MPERTFAHWGAAFFLLAAAALDAAALATTEWYLIDYAGSSIRSGVFETCINGACARNADYWAQGYAASNGACSHPGTDLTKRLFAVFGLTIASGALALMGAFLVWTAGFRPRAMGAMLLAFLAMGSQIAADVLYPFTLHKFYYCDDPYCSKQFAADSNTGPCSSFFGFSYAIAIVAGASTVMGSVLTLLCACRAEVSTEKVSVAAPSAEPAHPGGEPQLVSAASPDRGSGSAAVASAAQAPQQGHSAGALPASEHRGATEMRALTTTTTNNASLDGWEQDPQTGLFWSDSEKLFFDPVSGHFYDPESELWYDPTTEQWYQGAEQ